MNKLFCVLIGHKYRVLRNVSHEIREIECARCKKQFGMHDGLKVLLPLDQEMRDAHESISPSRKQN